MVLEAKDRDDDELSLSTTNNNFHSQKRCKKVLIQETRAGLARISIHYDKHTRVWSCVSSLQLLLTSKKRQHIEQTMH